MFDVQRPCTLPHVCDVQFDGVHPISIFENERYLQVGDLCCSDLGQVSVLLSVGLLHLVRYCFLCSRICMVLLDHLTYRPYALRCIVLMNLGALLPFIYGGQHVCLHGCCTLLVRKDL